MRWGLPAQPLPKRPYRDSILIYAGLAGVVVLFAWVTGGPVRKAVVVAGLFFVAGASWNALLWRRRLRAAERERAEAEQLR